MPESRILEDTKIHFLALTVGCYFALHLGDHVTAFVMAFVPDSFAFNNFAHRVIPSTIGYGIVGFLLGYSLWILFKQSATKVIKYTPLIMLIVENIQVYINFQGSYSSGNYSPYGLLVWLLSSIKGYQILIVFPVFVIATVWYFNGEGATTKDSVESGVV